MIITIGLKTAAGNIHEIKVGLTKEEYEKFKKSFIKDQGYDRVIEAGVLVMQSIDIVYAFPTY